MIPTTENVNLKEIIENYGNFKNIVLVGVSSLITWFFTTKKMKAEIEKVRMESTEKRIAIIKSVSESRDNFSQSSETLGILINDTIESMKERNVEKLRTNRLEMNNFFYNDFMCKFNFYFELKEASLIYSSKDSKYFIEDDILPFLNCIINFKNTTNFDFVLSILSTSPIEISEESIKYLKRFMQKNTKIYNFKLRNKFNDSFKAILK